MLVTLNEQDISELQQHRKKAPSFANAHTIFNLEMLVLKE